MMEKHQVEDKTCWIQPNEKCNLQPFLSPLLMVQTFRASCEHFIFTMTALRGTCGVDWWKSTNDNTCSSKPIYKLNSWPFLVTSFTPLIDMVTTFEYLVVMIDGKALMITLREVPPQWIDWMQSSSQGKKCHRHRYNTKVDWLYCFRAKNTFFMNYF